MRHTKRPRVRFLASALVALAMLGAGCGDDGTASSTTDPASSGSDGEARSGGTLTIADKGEIATLDPVKLTGSSSVGANHAFAIFDSLLINDPETGEPVPQLAAGFTSSDATAWTLKLRPDVSFTDGTPLDAEAVKFNWERVQDPDNSSPNKGSADQIATMEVVDAQTLNVTLKGPNAGFANLLTDRLGFIGSPAAIQADPEGFGSNPVGAGPFVFKEWVRDDRMTLTRNTDYWNAPLPYVDEVVFRVIVDGTQRLRSFEAGEIDLDRTTAPQDVSAGKRGGAEVTAFDANLGMVVLLNHRQPPFDDLDVRKAMSLALDRDDFNAVLNDGEAAMMTSLFSESSPWRVDSVKIPGYDQAEAQRLFDEYESKNGKPLSFTMSTFQNPESRLIGEYVQAQLDGYGVQVELDVGEAAAVVESVSKGSYAAVHWSFPAGPDPEPLVYDSFHSESPINRFGYSNAVVDEALELGRSTVDFEARKAAYQTAQEQIIDDYVSVWLYHQSTAYIHSPGVENLGLTGDGIVLSDRVWFGE